MGFKRIATILIAITFIVAAAICIYFWRKINAPKNLESFVPNNVEWFYQFKTKQIRDKATGKKPEYIDSVSDEIAGFDIFKNTKDPADLGIDLYSDLVIFKNDFGTYVLLSVTSENRLTQFVKEKISKDFVSELIPNKNCNFVQAKNRNLYFAWKGKACVLFSPTEKLYVIEKARNAVNLVFSAVVPNINSLDPIIKLNKQQPDVIFYERGNLSKKTHGVNLSQKPAIIVYPDKNLQKSKLSPLWLFEKLGLVFNDSETEDFANSNVKIESNYYINLTFKIIYYNLKNLQNDKE